ncbi:taurine ABC transporter substrate-binding protein [Devosia rhizoryzae]|uniref:Taurine ABC transporter substrate-binding protein n=1 Tax=Devosia rhizoryzae TaxID=2774137 RepID=A0ABX7C2S0_9HYPH|nr:taurine ABC transporter substrate-binding protein [Devosia rhizoryzae]QQR38498.1 taurine ABC transporter substrate-binding protein [Devosia rhizoryzae]
MNIARNLLKVMLASVALTSLGTVAASAVDLRIGWQPIVEPSRVPQADGTYEQATGATVTWNRFEGGADVVAAIASGSIDIGYVGSSPLTVAVSQQLPIETIFVVGNIAEAEALAVKGVTTPEELAGKKIATPFVSTAHYSLLTALKHWGVDAGSVEILNLRPPEIAAAWERGDIDGAYVWDPVLTQIKSTGGTVLADSADVAEWGGPTFDAWIVRKEYAEANPDVVEAFVKVTGDAYAAYLADPEAWNAESAEAGKIAELSGANAADVPLLLKGYVFPSLEQQASADFLGGGTTEAIAATAAFLVEQGRISAALPDYSGAVTTKFVEAAIGQ